MASPAVSSAARLPAGFDLTDPEIYAERLPDAEFAELRRNEPIKWIAQPDDKSGGFKDGGYWAITRHEDIKEISLLDEVFSSEVNGAIPRFHDETTREQLDAQRILMLNQDAPKHTRQRRIISRGFTPRHILPLHDDLRARAQQIAKDALARGSGDFVVEVASELPLQAIAGLMGVPQADRGKLFDWTNQMTSYDDPEFAHYDPATSALEIIGYGLELAELKRRNPGHDIVTTLVEADLDGEKLNDDELGYFIILLAVAGSETTRNSITQGMMAFTENPDQWELFISERPATTADEVVRWATPVTAFQRTATRDHNLNGTLIEQGQRVVMFYRSANFDEDVFDDPYTFNILREPNPHVGFGGTGAHYCIGTHLARMTIGLIFDAIADNMPDLTPLDRPQRLRSGWLNGIKHWHVDYAGKS
ncbi:steroid C27-monooxygenase [Mycolicibacter engbaekii]|uniref:Steroid C27-monooxygenase n=1 Tax=Mycolicibacter engbaekii TaxID=188915 RepID=A0A1X1TC77_9MYCO|nr:cytochrome P450 [Mycolicibacter engbaekii]ORV42172.1 steroid C27-monooxygenase [Mycolicibacter engbaekii]